MTPVERAELNEANRRFYRQARPLLLAAALSAASCGAARAHCRAVVTTWTDYDEGGHVIGARPVTLTVCDR